MAILKLLFSLFLGSTFQMPNKLNSITNNRWKINLKNGNKYEQCDCLETDTSACSMKSVCVNVMTNTECVPELCPAKENCNNQNFQKGVQFLLQTKMTKSKGLGLFAGEEISIGKFIIEYMGEFINNKEFDRRNRNSNGGCYVLQLSSDIYIDASTYGNAAKYINHSCDPNAASRKWVVYSNGNEQTRIGFFALRKINPVEAS